MAVLWIMLCIAGIIILGAIIGILYFAWTKGSLSIVIEENPKLFKIIGGGLFGAIVSLLGGLFLLWAISQFTLIKVPTAFCLGSTGITGAIIGAIMLPMLWSTQNRNSITLAKQRKDPSSAVSATDTTTRQPDPNSSNEEHQREQQDARERLRWERLILLPLTGLPCLLGFCLFLFNSQYLGRMIFSCAHRGAPIDLCSQPIGWLLTLIVIILVSVAFLGVYGSLLLKNNWRYVIVSFIFIFIVIPALLIVFLGPAFLVMLETPGFAY